MQKIILHVPRQIPPFNEPARDLRIQNKPLWLVQRDVLAPYVNREIELTKGSPLPDVEGPCIVYCDNLYFDSAYIQTFLSNAKKLGKPCQAAFSTNDSAFTEHALPLSTSYHLQDDIFLVDLWFFPDGPVENPEPLIVDLQSREVGYYHIPYYMAHNQGDLVFRVPLRSLIAIDSWVHIFIADIVFGLFTRGVNFEQRLDNNPFYKLKILSKGMYEGNQVLECSEVVNIGRNCVIDPTAIIHGPTSIGDNVTIGAGAVIENCIIGSNVNVSQGCQLMLSVVGDGAFLPFRSSLFMTTMMDNSMVAQNTCLQMSVVGRNTFIGAGTTFTDFNLLPTKLRALDGNGFLSDANRPVLGGCVGHNCRIGSGIIIFPGRTIESDVVLVASSDRRVIERDVAYVDSDHQYYSASYLHQRLYPGDKEMEISGW